MTGKSFQAMKSRFFSTLTLLLFLATGVSLRAEEISVTAGLSRSEVNSGDMAELQIKVSGAQRADVPQQIPVEGLNVRLTGQSTQVQMVNFKVTSSVVYSYIVMPLRTGHFTIPSVTVSADGSKFRTQSLPFSVLDTSGPSSSGGVGVTSPSMQPQIPALPGMVGTSQPRSRPIPSRPDLERVAFGVQKPFLLSSRA